MQKNLELVYPIYLDTPMMTAFLASLEGGLVEEADIQKRSGSVEERNRSLRGGFNISSLLSGIVGASADAELTRNISQDLESQYKSVVRFPNATLFIRLRNTLLRNQLVTIIEDEAGVNNVEIGDLVEFRGFALTNPSLQIRKLFTQIIPIVEQAYKQNQNKFDKTLQMLKKAKPGSSIIMDDNEIKFSNQSEINVFISDIEFKKANLENELELMNIGKTVLDGLLPSDISNKLPFECNGFHAICRTYPEFIRNNNLDDLNDAHWFCLGKVIGVTLPDDVYDLLKGLPIGYVAKDQISSMISSMSNGDVQIDITSPVISGPCLLIAPMAIYA